MTTQRLAEALSFWKRAKAKDDELTFFVAGQEMARAIEEFLKETGNDNDNHLHGSPIGLRGRDAARPAPGVL